jgi:hypothetical protein
MMPANCSDTFFFKGIDVYVIDPIVGDVDFREVMVKLQEKVPHQFFVGLDSIYIGHFQHLEEKELVASYDDGSIFMTNVQDSQEGALKDIIHEMAHLVEENYSYHLYDDGEIGREFLDKRKQLLKSLKLAKNVPIDIESLFNELEYNKDLDDYFHQDLGYSYLNRINKEIFSSPYGATSLREYFANTLEEYYFGDAYRTMKISPATCDKIDQIESYGTK